jgi:hypothetical protein
MQEEMIFFFLEFGVYLKDLIFNCKSPFLATVALRGEK